MKEIPTSRCAKFIVGYWTISAGVGILCSPIMILMGKACAISSDQSVLCSALLMIFTGLFCLVWCGFITWLGILGWKSLDQLRALAAQ
jgi:hypothetical protein